MTKVTKKKSKTKKKKLTLKQKVRLFKFLWILSLVLLLICFVIIVWLYFKPAQTITKTIYIDKPAPTILCETIHPKDLIPPKQSNPKLAIIIDDVATKYEVKKILQIPYKITPSFFPDIKAHPSNPTQTMNFPIYMVHLPLQASAKFHRQEQDVLNTTDSITKIDNQISNIKYNFPNLKYINNHTGSVFSDDYDSMKRLLSVVKKYNINYIDSKTISSSKAPQVAQQLGMKIRTRDIFIDNIDDEKYIIKQLKKAIKIAKKRGYAIAIGHPKKLTLKVLKNSKNLFKGINLVYIDDI